MKVLNRFFLKGLVVVVPVIVSIYIFLLAINKAEGIFAPLLKQILGSELYIPGLGILVTITLLILVGVLVSNFITGSIIRFLMNTFEKVPFIKAIYNPLRDLISLFGGSGPESMKKVVMVNLPITGGEVIGLVTREEFSDLPSQMTRTDCIAVYIPLSYMLGGVTTIVPKSSVREVDIPVERAIKLAITGWIKADKNSY